MKNLINYLSKKSLSLGNGSGMTRKWFGNGSGMTRKWFGNDSGMTRFSLASLICLCMLTVGVGTAWGTNWSYTFSATPTWSPNSGTTRSMTVNSATWSVSTGTATGSPSTWGEYANAYSSGGITFGNSSKNYYQTITLSTNYFTSYQVSAVTVNLLINGSVSTTITVTQGTTTIGTPSYSTANDWYDFTANTNTGTSGTLTLSIATTQAIRIHSISVTYTEPSCTKVAAPSVTATPSSTKIDLSWAAVTNASSYSVTCKIKSTGVAAGTVGGVSGSGPYSCSITGLTDGTEYTWSVMSVGDGSTYCASGNTPATGDAIPGTYYTVTWNAAGSSPQTTSVRSGTKPTFPSTPSSCDATSTTFYGWATSTWSGPLDDVSAKTIYTSASDMPTVSGSGVNYYAVFAKKSASGDYVKGTKSDLTDGQTVMIVNSYNSAALSSEDDSDYNEFYRDGVDVSISSNKISSPASALIWTVELGENSGYYFKHGDNYIEVSYASSNYWLYFDEDTDEWQVSGSGPYVLTSGNYSSYKLWYDDEDGLFDVYTGTGNAYNIDFYIPEITYSKYLTTCCTPLGEPATLTFDKTAYTITATWTATSGGHEDGYSVQLYNSSSEAIDDPIEIDCTSSCDLEYEFTSLSANTTYYVGVTPTYSGGTTYCSTGTEKKLSVKTDQVYTVTYNNGGGSGTMTDSNSPYEAGDEVTVKENTFTKSGYTFTAWSYSPAVTVTDGKFEMPSSNVVITATWTAKKNYYVDRMHGNCDGVNTVTIDGVVYNCYLREGAGYTRPDLTDNDGGTNDCVTGHAHFIGWVAAGNISADGSYSSGTIYAGGSSGTATTDGTIYYAVWAEE